MRADLVLFFVHLLSPTPPQHTHFLFPLQPYFDLIRMRELRKILGFVELYRLVASTRTPTPPSPLTAPTPICPLVLCGDFNGGPSGMQYRPLTPPPHTHTHPSPPSFFLSLPPSLTLSLALAQLLFRYLP